MLRLLALIAIQLVESPEDVADIVVRDPAKVAWLSFGLMFAGAVMVDAIILVGKADVMMTSYLPLLAHPLFYLGIILVAVGTLTGVFNFFATIYVARRDKTYEGSMPIVARRCGRRRGDHATCRSKGVISAVARAW